VRALCIVYCFYIHTYTLLCYTGMASEVKRTLSEWGDVLEDAVDELGLSYMSVSMEVVNILAQHVMASKQVCVCV
jgi:hypothetical protein